MGFIYFFYNMFGSDSGFFRDPHYRFHRAIVLEDALPMRTRRMISIFTGSIILGYMAFMIVPSIQSTLVHGVSLPKDLPSTLSDKTIIVPDAENVSLPEEATLPQGIPLIGGIVIPLSTKSSAGNGIFFMALSLWLLMKMLQYYGRSYYYYVEGLLERGKTGAQTPYTTPNYEVCDIYYAVSHGDLLKAYCTSPYGRLIMRRCGIADQTIDEYLSSRVHVVNYNEIESDLRKVFTLLNLSELLIEKDPDFYQFLFELGIRDRELVGAAEWVERSIKRKKQKERWWGKVALGQSSSFGSELAFGSAYFLGRYSEDLSKKAVGGGSNFRFVYGNEQIKQLENVLARSKEANAILIGEDGSGKMDVILDFARDIMNGYTNSALKHKRVMAFSTKTFIANMRTKQELETSLIKLMNDAVKAGNIILVIEDLPGFIRSGFSLDSDVVSLIDPYLAGTQIQVIATADNARFHQFIEPNNAIMQRFEKVVLTEPADESLIRILEEVAENNERRNPIYFTYPAITEIIHCAQNYFTEGIMPDKAIDLLVEIAPTVLSRGGHLVKKLEVLQFVREKTNIPVGNITDDERERLQNIEGLMHDLVIGQEQAIDVIANAMRRSRAGVRNTNRPIGTFLFLGPTGVGKTETAKALATVFFGSENAMSRLDMSEYQGEDGLSRMIGGMDGTPGALPVMLKEQPYGVILLDEFEKTNPKVLDLFLQVLDEGIFHDAQGRLVNGRNTIFIATSNAGADEIRAAMKSGVELEAVKKQIIDKIIMQGKIKPELFNRFDGIILFHQLRQEDYEKIALLMLKKLQKRLREKSINLIINDAVKDAVLFHGVDPEFGARPMTRAIQEIVEQKVAEKIINGRLVQGASLEFTYDDFPGVPPRMSAPVSPLDHALTQIPTAPPRAESVQQPPQGPMV